MFVINCKNYEEISGVKLLKLIKTVEKISRKYKIKIAVSPPQSMLSFASEKTSIPILAQHLDNAKVGSTTGYMIPEIVKGSKVDGSIINHSEHRLSKTDIQDLIKRMRDLKLISVLCVKNVAEVKKYVNLKPDYIAIEPPQLIGTGKAISKERPSLISNAAKIVQKTKRTKLLCGAGIVSGADVEKAIQLGSKGILVASGIIKSKNWEEIISDFAKAMV
ncbi:MAG: triose-phosphate isomerase [Nitrosopumilaceae archaeon]|nr:triose-phosphate isomerase [Nitrosopumilaceae archaeon]NIU01176.1 triose-phosphate isomerase [Nitrosopumilaceae archaeon]NIU87545.1 triose-phosphate isomerase [Nitrosopumilaceae archaeon]NIV66010.1 triose-phosphate isomerase [Nitrosopumilaceae archaeon]NIX61778.1 triose-phosphate isomerase [Nitrosopumilaceae archaeon]